MRKTLDYNRRESTFQISTNVSQIHINVTKMPFVTIFYSTDTIVRVDPDLLAMAEIVMVLIDN